MEMEELVEETVETVRFLGPVSILPVAVIFVVSIITKRTLFAMLCGVVAGALILAGGLPAFPETFFGYLYKTFSDETFQWIFLVVTFFGVIIALFEKSGAVMDFGLWLTKFLKSKKQVLMGTFFFGLVVFVDDYLSNLTVGATMRKITDRLKIPRTQLAYIVNLMAGPVSLLIPLSSWTAAYTGVFETEGILVNGSPFVAFLHSIPLIFYAWVALIICLLQILGIIPKMGMIKRDYAQAESTGNVFPAGCTPPVMETDMESAAAADENVSKNPLPWNFLVPLAVIVTVTFLSGLDILFGTAAGTLTAFVLYLVERKASFLDMLTACYEGVIKIALPLILFVLAFSIKAINDDTGMPPYIISVVEPLMKGSFLPLVVFIVCAAYAFFTGACWDLAMIIMPIVVPLSVAMGVDPVFTGAAVFSGALFGNVFCPYGDGVILCSQACEIRPVDLMFAIAPYMLIAGGVTAALYLVTGFIF
jgi:Na+/H+ antiporter NhaC